jgi:hypothetical protein
MNITNLVLLYEQVMLEYSEGFLKQQVERLQKQNVHATPENIKQMLQRFDQLKAAGNTKQEIKNIITTDIESGTIKAKNPKDQKRIDNLKRSPWNVEFYDFPELEKVVHSFRDVADSQVKKDLKNVSTTDTGAELVYETPDHMLQVFYAKDGPTAYKFKRWLLKNKEKEIEQAQAKIYAKWGTTPEALASGKFKASKQMKDELNKVTPLQGVGHGLYGWCISGEEGRNLFVSYRMCGDSSASLYFVLDNKLPFTDDKHVIVIHAHKNGTYMVTGANNVEDNKGWLWNQVVAYQPALKNVNKNIFKFRSFTEEEQLYLLTKDAQPEDFAGFTPRIKKAYIDLGPQNKIYSQDYINLVNVDPSLSYVQRQEATEFGKLLQRAYINVRSPNANDPDIMSRLFKLLYLFEDTNMFEVNMRIAQSREAAENLLATGGNPESDLSWQEPLFQDKTMQQTKDKGVFNYWKKLIDGSLRNLGDARTDS